MDREAIACLLGDKMNTHIASLMAICCMAPTCQPMPQDPVVPVVSDAATCVGACDCSCLAMARVGCREAAPTAKGESCRSVCESANAFPGLKLPNVADCQDQSCIVSRGVDCSTSH